jgi:hypothetical protein
MPSLPVALPTMKTGLPAPWLVALITLSAFTMPTLMAFTKGLVV